MRTQPVISASRRGKLILSISLPPYPFGKAAEECCCHNSISSSGIVMMQALYDNTLLPPVPCSILQDDVFFPPYLFGENTRLPTASRRQDLRVKFQGRNEPPDWRCPWQLLHARLPHGL